jgi:hypothetical protein
LTFASPLAGLLVGDDDDDSSVERRVVMVAMVTMMTMTKVAAMVMVVLMTANVPPIAVAIESIILVLPDVPRNSSVRPTRLVSVLKFTHALPFR